MKKIIDKYFREPYVNVLCVELEVSISDYNRKRNISIVTGIILAILFLFIGIVVKSLVIVILAFLTAYVGYRYQYLNIKRKESKTRAQLVNIYPLFVQTFISLLYTNDNLIKVFLLLESYHFDPYIDRALVIMINKYQINPESSELIFAEFCNIFETSSASLLHQLMVNIGRYGVNDDEIKLIESKIDQDYDKYIIRKTQEDSKKVIQSGYIGVVALVALLLSILISSL